jgi:hypothetical protein
MKPLALAGAMAGGLAGAMAWAAISFYLSVEIGYVAWAVGGLVGFGAYILGGRGSAMGGACAAVALGSIFLGKLLALKLAVGATGVGDPREAFGELGRDAAAFAAVKSEKDYAAFMVKHGYAEARNSSGVDDEQIEFFKTRRAPMLREIHEKNLTFEEWEETPEGAAYVEDMQTARAAIDNALVSLVFKDLNAIDIIFALLGIMTAYRIGVGKPEAGGQSTAAPGARRQVTRTLS